MTRTIRSAALATGAFALALALAGCGSGSEGPGVATAGTPAPSAAASGGSGSGASQIAYAQCMRAHGVPDFPDPDADGRLTIKATRGSDLAPDSPAFIAADNACKSLRPVPDATQQAQNLATALKYSQCMRSHGVPDFPDPDSNGGIKVQMRPGSDMDPNSPQFQAAQKACQAYQPGGPGGKTTQGGPGGDGS